MKLNMRTAMFAGTIAALIAGPSWAASDSAREGAYTPAPGKAETRQSERGQPTAGQPMSETPRIGAQRHDSTARTSANSNPLYLRSADDLKGLEVVDASGKRVGAVTQIVLAPDRKSAHALISASGALGIGANEIMVSLDELMPIDDKLRLSATEEEVSALKDSKRNTEQYVEVTGATPISGSIVEFSAFEQGTQSNQRGTPMMPNMGADQPMQRGMPGAGAGQPMQGGMPGADTGQPMQRGTPGAGPNRPASGSQTGGVPQ